MSGKPSKARLKKPIETPLGQAADQAAEVQDLSHLRKPINTSVVTLKQLFALCEKATIEVQNYINYECDILFECRICRSIFRSLANFILHKRNYCQEKFYCFRNSEDGGFLIETNQIGNRDDKSTTEKSDTKPNKKSIESVVDKLQKQHEIIEFSKSIINEDLSNDTPNFNQTRMERAAVILQKVDFSDSAVFQTLSSDLNPESNKDNLMKSEVMEIHGILENNEAVLGMDGKVCDFETSKKIAKPNIPKQHLVCTECHFKFSTKKTLTSHIKYKHNKTCMVFPCPDCQETFANAWSVYRHLYKVHRRTRAQVRRMRIQVLSNAIRKEQEKIKKVAKTSETRENEEDQWMNNLESDGDLRMCGGCGKKFERRAALQSHSQTCVRRMAVCNTINIKQKSNLKSKNTQAEAESLDTPISEVPIKNKSNQSDAESNAIPKLEIQSKGAAKRKQKTTRINYKSSIVLDELNTPSSFNSSDNSNEEVVVETINEIDSQCCIEDFDKVKIVDVSEIFKRSNDNNSSIIDRESMLDIIGVARNDNLKISNDTTTHSVENGTTPTIDMEKLEITPKNDYEIAENSNTIFESPEIYISDDSCKFSEQESVPSPKSPRPETVDDESEKFLKTAKFLNDIIDYFSDPNDQIFVAKASLHLEERDLSCLPCQISFASLYQLLWHMSLHFSWFRFQCTKCAYMTFDKYDCATHAYTAHRTSSDFMDSTVLPIPKWKTRTMAHDFINLRCLDLSNRNVPKPVLKGSIKSEFDINETDETEIGDCEESQMLIKTSQNDGLETIMIDDNIDITKESEDCQPLDTNELIDNDRDPLANGLDCATTSSVNQTGTSRPVRLRTKSVKTLQDDFIYDLGRALKLNDNAVKTNSGKLKRKWPHK